MSDKFFIDTNIILYAISTVDDKKYSIAKPLVLGGQATISVQVINECSVNLLKKMKFTEHQIEKFIDSSYSRYHVVNLDKNIFIQASHLREKYFLSYYDSIIVSTALISNCSILYSEDMQHNILIENKLRIINPFI